MGDASLVTIVIPAYNASRYVAEAIASARAQTWPNVEIVVVDDGSSDDTAAVVERQDVQLIRTPNRGPSAARNTGLAAARGEYVQFLDADDVLHPDKVQRCMVSTAGGSIPFSRLATFFDGQPLSAARPRDRREGLPYPITRRSPKFDPVEPLASALSFVLSTPGPLHRRDLLTRVGGFDERLRNTEDIELQVRLVLAGARFVDVPELLVYRRDHDQGRLRSAPTALEHSILGEQLMAEQILARSSDPVVTPRARIAMADRLANTARRAVLAGRNDDARGLLELVERLGGAHSPTRIPAYNWLARRVGVRNLARVERFGRERLVPRSLSRR